MPSNLDKVRNLLQFHYDEASTGLVDKPPSRLTRGEGTEKPYYIMKIDLVGSTRLLLGRQKSTYLKFAHTFLSTIDGITQQFGAEPSQVEYAGDSVLAYFPEDVASDNVVEAACYCRAAVRHIGEVDNLLRSFQLQCKIVLDYADLIVARIGPRAGSNLFAIGYPLHTVAKLEKEVQPNAGRATLKFYQQVSRENKRFFSPIEIEEQVLYTPPAPTPAPPSFYPNKLDEISLRNGLYNALYGRPIPAPTPQPIYIPQKKVIGYHLNWLPLLNKFKLLPSS